MESIRNLHHRGINSLATSGYRLSDYQSLTDRSKIMHF